MNRRLFGILICLVLGAAYAAAQSAHSIIRATDSNEDTHYYYYNEQNQLIWELYGNNRREYSYNAAGQQTQMKLYAWVAFDGAYTVTRIEDYTYDADGNMTIKDVQDKPGTAYSATWKYTYSDFVNGVATYYDEYKNGSLYYMYKQQPEFDEAQRLTKCDVYYADPDDYDNPTHETVTYDELDYTYTKTYDAEGNLAGENTGKVSYTYTYTDLNASYTPANLKAENNKGKVTLTWDAVPSAEKYIVSYDQERKEVSETTYSVTLGTGNRLITVQAVIGDMERNAATPVSVTVDDPGKLPITDLAVGKITETEEETESEELTTRTFYNIPLTWSLPTGHSAILGFRVYYNSTAYGKETRVPVTDPTATSYTLKVDPFEVMEWDEEGVPYKGIDTPIFVTIIYSTGESERSNVVVVNPYDELHGDPEPAYADVTFIVDGAQQTSTLEVGSIIPAPSTPAKEGYTFTGWQPAFVEGATVPEGGITYTAQWTVNTYTVTYVFNGVTVGTCSVEYGGAIPECNYAPEDPRYTIVAWRSDADYTSMPAHDITYTADVADGISSVQTSASHATDVYTLTGVKLSATTPLTSGTYIIGGKKVMIRK